MAQKFSLRCVIFALILSASDWGFCDELYHPVLFGGGSVAGRTGMMPRAGFDLALMYGQHRDGFGGFGLEVGTARISDDEYYIGPALGVFGMGTIWIEAVAHFRRSEFSGIRLTSALGYFLMPFISVGNVGKLNQASAEFGVMVRFPLYFSEK